ncbi:hypothetical protein SAMN05216334_1089 [Nitrosomonas ureae]|uniref:Uncharacterized protein n=1 Tax=Nitrosomonas ureae TaxID=44577 RepID=A0A1H5UI36_9PROT|nr:hypothetical protein SAMN05216334_1089 [Nitrosomonas ureae]
MVVDFITTIVLDISVAIIGNIVDANGSLGLFSIRVLASPLEKNGDGQYLMEIL